jgi:hypothetical protein
MGNISGNYISSKWALPPRVKRPGREANYSPPYSAEVKNGGTTPPPPLTCLHGVLRDRLIYQFLCDLGGGRKKHVMSSMITHSSFITKFVVTERIILSFYIIGTTLSHMPQPTS